MLTYAFRELKQNNYEEIAGEDFDNIQQLFAEILIKGISCQLKQGIFKQYIIRKDSLPTLRGKLDLNATIQNKLCRKQEIGCEYDELSESNIFNQIIKATVFGLLKHGNIKKDQKTKLKNLMLFFSGIDIIELSTVKWNMLTFDRNNKSYQMLLYVCYFLTDIIRKTKCFRILERNAKISKTKRNFSRLYPTPQKFKKIDRLRRNEIHLKAVRTSS